MLRVSFSVVSSGIKAAFAVPVVAKDLSQRPLLTEMEKSSVKVCVHSHLSFDRQWEFGVDISGYLHNALLKCIYYFYLVTIEYSAAFSMQTGYQILF